MNTCGEDIFWIFVWIAIAFFSRATMDLIYEVLDRFFDTKSTLADNFVIMIISFLILFGLVRICRVDMSRKKQLPE